MTQVERLDYLISYLLKEANLNIDYINESIESKKKIYRALVNIRLPKDITNDYLKIEDAYLKEELNNSYIYTIDDLEKVGNNLYLYRGDITKLKVDAIVNAANRDMLGCFYPNHSCIDNIIHTKAGIRLRLRCNEIMKGTKEPTGTAKITEAYNLPSSYIIHTVGPIIYDKVNSIKEEELASSYLSSLKLAKNYKLQSIAFPCISTGEFRFPKDKAAIIATNTVKNFLKENDIKVIFDIFTDEDYKIYRSLL